MLVATTDGVGTKLKIAIESGSTRTIGIDLVAMCVNDLVVQGAEPLLFLDYFATGALDVEAAAVVIEGIAEGCRMAGAGAGRRRDGGDAGPLPSAATTILPASRSARWSATSCSRAATSRAGDVMLGLASSGVHSNGFSLVRRVVEMCRLRLVRPGPVRTGEKPRRGAARRRPASMSARALRRSGRPGAVKALAHITGGGLLENIPRVLPGASRGGDRPCGDPRAAGVSAGSPRSGRRSGDAPHLQLRDRHGARRRSRRDCQHVGAVLSGRRRDASCASAASCRRRDSWLRLRGQARPRWLTRGGDSGPHLRARQQPRCLDRRRQGAGLSGRDRAGRLRPSEAAGLAIAHATRALPQLSSTAQASRTRPPSRRRSTPRSRSVGVELVCLAGFMRLLSPAFVEAWRDGCSTSTLPCSPPSPASTRTSAHLRQV